MALAELILDDKSRVVEAWYDKLLSTYPPETAKIWKKNKNQFTNPVGHRFLEALGELVEQVVEWSDASAVCAPLEEIVKIRAVQDFTPGKALSFIFAFKKVLREVFRQQARGGKLEEELAVFDNRVDNLALMAFDVYTKNREQLYDMRLREFKNAHYMVFRKAGVMCEQTAITDLEDFRGRVEDTGESAQDKER